MEERRRNLITTIFAKRDVHDICKSKAIEHRADGVSNVEHQHSQAAVRLIWAGAALVRCSTNTADRCQRPVDQSDDGAKFYAPHGPRERVTAKLTAPRFDISSGLELRKNLLKKFDRQFFFRS
jgi:hypothetical protein